MRPLTKDERRALSFVGLVVVLATVARMAAAPEPVLPGEEGLDVEALAASSRRALEAEERRSKPLGPGERLDPNRASAEALDRLPGVGPALADRIVAARNQAPFRAPTDLTRVAGVGEKTAARLAGHLDFSRAPPPALGRGRPTPRRRTGAGRAVPMASSGLDLNRATAAELETLPGVGPVLAARIVVYRDSAGEFRSLEELTEVEGIGPKTLERIRGALRPLR